MSTVDIILVVEVGIIALVHLLGVTPWRRP